MTSTGKMGTGLVIVNDAEARRRAWHQLDPEEQATVRKYLANLKHERAPADKGRRWGNAAEDQCFRLLIANGFEPSRLGFPDFWFIRDGKLFFIEVKRTVRTPLKGSQREFHEAAAKHGILTYRWDPYNGFSPIGHTQPIGILNFVPTIQQEAVEWRRCRAKNGVYRCRSRLGHQGNHQAWNSAGRTLDWTGGDQS